MATSIATKEATWIKRFLCEIGFYSPKYSIQINSDNQGAIALAKNPIEHARTKHIDIRHHFIREKLESGDINIAYCGTGDMVADILTKGLARDKHEKHTREMGLQRQALCE